MVLPAFNGERLKKRLIQFDSKRQLAFAAACCERLLPNYLVFNEESGWGDITTLRNALDQVWAFLEGQGPSSQEIEDIAASCDAVTPDSEDFGSVYADLAQDACLAISNLLSYLFEGGVEKVVYAVTYATDSVDLYVQEAGDMDPNDPELEQKILTHPLMQRELAQQEKELEMIEQASSLSPEFLKQLRSAWDNNAKKATDLF